MIPTLLYIALVLGCQSPQVAPAGESLPEPQEFVLWPDGVPGAAAIVPKEVVRGGAGDLHLAEVHVPSVTVYLPARDKANGCAVIICPGGGYGILAIDKEGHDIARWFASHGVAGIVLKYRMPRPTGHVFGHEAPLDDCRASLALVRSRATAWRIDPKRVGVMGFSAGGHLASSASVLLTKQAPAFTVLVYPVISMKSGITHGGSRRNLLGPDPSEDLVARFSSELQISPRTPPAFLVHTQDDPIALANSRLYALGLEKAKVPFELHVFSKGGHGYGMRRPELPVGQWPNLLLAWMGESGWIEN